MNKILRYSFILLLALIANVSFGQTKFDFDNDYKTLFPTLKGVSDSKGSTDGDFTESTTCNLEGITITVSPKSSGSNENRIWTSSPRLRLYSGTLTIEAPEGKSISKISCENGKWNSGNTADAGTLTKDTWTGSANKVVITIAGNTQIKSITVTIGNGGDTPTPPATTYTDVASIKDLLANYMEATTNLNLKFTNAKVLYVNNYNGTVNTYVREGESAIELRTLGFDMPVNSVINGTVKVDLDYTYGVPYLKANAGTDDESLNIAESTEAATPIAATVADILANKYMNDLVIIKDFTFSKEEYTTGKYNYYANDNENKIMLYDKFGKIGGVADLTDGDKYTVVGLFGAIFKGTQEILPTKSIAETTGINGITTDVASANAPVYNLAGQKVSASYKGVVVKAGKKYIQK